MANKFGSFLKKRLLGKNRNLVSFDEPFEVMPRLLKGHRVTGIIDAGASNGRISKRLLRRFPAAQAYAFEPNPLYEGGALYSEIDLFLRGNGFGLYDMYKPKYGPNGLVMWANAIFVNLQRLGL